MNRSRFLAANAAVSIGVLVAAGSADAQAAPIVLHNTEVAGTLVDQYGHTSTFDDMTRFSPSAANSSRGAQNYAVNGNASDTSHGLVSAQVIMSSPEQNTADGGFASFLSGTASLSFIIGFNPTGVPLPPDVVAHLYVGALGGMNWNWDGNADVEFLIRDSQTEDVVVDEKLLKGPGFDPIADSESFTLNQTFDLSPNETYQVFMSASASGFLVNIDPTQPDGMEVTASVDPTFKLVGDTASLWTLTGIPVEPNDPGGVTPGVPEPASWTLMIAGFGLTGRDTSPAALDALGLECSDAED